MVVDPLADGTKLVTHATARVDVGRGRGRFLERGHVAIAEHAYDDSAGYLVVHPCRQRRRVSQRQIVIGADVAAVLAKRLHDRPRHSMPGRVPRVADEDPWRRA